MSDVLGVKRNQIQGIINPDTVLVESVDTQAVRKMAADFLRQRGQLTEGLHDDEDDGV
jgi:hypothetical protein